MMLFLKLLLVLFFPMQTSGCEFIKENSFVILSGPTAHTIKELGLINSPQIKAISSFHYLHDFKGDVLKGGVFISPKYFNKYRRPIVFYDESLSLRKTLLNLKVEKNIEIKTKGLNNFEVFESSLKQVKKYLVNCEGKIKQVLSKVDKIKEQVLQWRGLSGISYFFLGEVWPKMKFPNLMIVKDGAIKYLIENKKIHTYESTASYISYSMKKMKKENVRFIGLSVDKKKTEAFNYFSKSMKNKSNLYVNYYGGQLLTPGLGQIYFLEKLIKDYP